MNRTAIIKGTLAKHACIDMSTCSSKILPKFLILPLTNKIKQNHLTITTLQKNSIPAPKSQRRLLHSKNTSISSNTPHYHFLHRSNTLSTSLCPYTIKHTSSPLGKIARSSSIRLLDKIHIKAEHQN